MKPWSAITVEISTCHSLISSYILHQPNSGKKRVEVEVSKPGLELVSAKKTGFSQQNQVFDEATSPQPVEKPSQTCKKSSKPPKKR